ncbi:MAG: hypothetical protein KAR47_06060, partial [Planctomycetes bacterium]|nr:hypothetical protein [Planctomycetota bacterium]
MYSEHLRHPQNRKRFLILLLSVVMALSCITTFLHADEEIAQPRVQRSIVKQLRYIEASTAKEYLVNLGIGTDINRLGSMNALIITTDNDLDRIKASSLISLIDSKTKFELIRLKIDRVPATMEKTSDIEAMIEGIAIGTFRNPPTGIDTPRAIIDVQGSDLIALVPNGYAPPVVAVLEHMYSSKVDAGKLPDAVKSNMDIQKTLMELAALSENETGITEETNFINAELLEALTTVEKEVEAITVTDQPVEKVGTEPAVIAEQIVVAERANRTAIKAEPPTMPAGVTVANNDVKTDEPSMAEILAMLGTMTSDSAGA